MLNKVALVTGSASGIGASISQLFARAGAHVYLADRDEKGGREVLDQIRSNGNSGEFICLDVSNEADCGRAADHVQQSHGNLDILVNNAGVGHVGTAIQTSAADLDRLYAVNLRGVFCLSKAFLPAMLARKYGVIINMASIGGVVGVRDRAAYCATKFGVVGLTKAMALDHAADGVRVNCICPGRVETPFVTARLKEYADPEKAYKEMAGTQALGRMAKPEEIAAAALYLASDEAAFITGADFIIDGGWSAGK